MSGCGVTTWISPATTTATRLSTTHVHHTSATSRKSCERTGRNLSCGSDRGEETRRPTHRPIGYNTHRERGLDQVLRVRRICFSGRRRRFSRGCAPAARRDPPRGDYGTRVERPLPGAAVTSACPPGQISRLRRSSTYRRADRQRGRRPAADARVPAPLRAALSADPPHEALGHLRPARG